MEKRNASSALGSKATLQLLKLHSDIMNELRRREIIRTSNNPTGDYAETLFQKAFDWTLERNSSSGHDATSKKGDRYQIKGRRMNSRRPSRQLGVIRNLESKKFDYLAGVLFNEDYSVHRAIVIPQVQLLKMKSRFSNYVNGQIFYLHDDTWKIAGVEDVTSKLRDAAKKL